MRLVALRYKTQATGKISLPKGLTGLHLATAQCSQTPAETLSFVSIANECMAPVLHLQKHSRYSLVPLIPCAESAPATYSSGTPAPWYERREQPCNLLRTPAIAARSPVSTVQIRFLCTSIGVSRTPLTNNSKQAYLWAACLEADSCFAAWTIPVRPAALPCILRYSTSRTYSASYIRSRLLLLLV